MKTRKSFHYDALFLFLISILFLSCNFSKESKSNELWETLESVPLNPLIEAQIDEMLPKLTLKQKVGQVIQG